MTKLEFLKLWSVKARRAYWQWRAANVTKARRKQAEAAMAAYEAHTAVKAP